MRVIALAAMTADGKIARLAPGPVDWTSREDKRMFARVTRRAGVVILGRATYELLPGPLPGRLVVVLTTRGAELTPQPGHVEFMSGAPGDIVASLAARGYAEAVVAGGAVVYQEFLRTGVVDELWLTVEPLLFGTGLPLLRDEIQGVGLRLLDVMRLSEQTVQLKYRVEVTGQRHDVAGAYGLGH